MKTVSDVMSRTLFTVTPETGVTSAARFAFTDQARHLLVLDNGALAGIVSHRDLSRAAPHQTVGQVMKHPVICVPPDTTVEEAAQIMQEHGVSFLPVIANNLCVGSVDGYIVDDQGDVTKVGSPAWLPN